MYPPAGCWRWGHVAKGPGSLVERQGTLPDPEEAPAPTFRGFTASDGPDRLRPVGWCIVGGDTRSTLPWTPPSPYKDLSQQLSAQTLLPVWKAEGESTKREV